MVFELIKLNKLIDISGLYTFFYYEHDANFFFSGERHSFWEIVYVDRGEISAVAENNAFIVKQGEIIFHKPNEFHSLASTKGDPHNILIASFETKSSAMSFFENKIFSLNKNQRRILSSFMKERENAFERNYENDMDIIGQEVSDAGSYQIAISLLENLLIDLLRNNSVNDRIENERNIAKKNVENALIDSVCSFLKDNIYGSISLQEICNHYSISKSYICQLFKTTTDKSIMDYYIELKIEEAKYLIRKGELNFTQIGEKLGYSSIYHFSRSFKHKVGMSPSSYEISIKEKN